MFSSASRRRIALVAVFLAAVMDLLDGTVVNVVLPAIQRELGADNAAAGWIASGYTLALGVLLTVGGRAGDRYGHRRVLLAGTAGFAAASLACAAAPTAGVLITARVAQGAASALMVPQALALVQLLHAPRERARAMGLFATVTGLTTVAGPVAGALLAEADVLGLGWRAVFLINVPVSGCVLAGVRTLPRTPVAARDTLDLPGAALLALGLVAVVLPLLQGGEAGATWWAGALPVLACVPLAAFVARERARTARGLPVLVDTRLFRHRGLTGAVVVSGLVFAAVHGLFFTLALYLQRGLDRSVATAALTVLPWSLGIPLASTPASRFLVPRHGRRVLGAGIAVLAAGLAGTGGALTAAPTGPGTLALAPWLLLAGCGMGLIVSPLLTLGLAEVPAHGTGTAAGLLQNVQQLGGAIGLACAAALYSAPLASASPGAAEATSAFRLVVWSLAGLCCATVPAVLLLPRRPES
ncbi:MFS transporter [Streptomyces sp. NPDC048172]|uniref:MFS transporter n=1 Tax=Streptomyces sp. NPDC048172 TaxID=3365505 RepID=UPI0037206E2C